MNSDHDILDLRNARVTAATAPVAVGAACTMRQFRRTAYDGIAMSPYVLVDDFTMWSPTFSLHPHAGMSAVTLMFEDTTGTMTSQDSIGHNMTFGAGDLHWTLAGRGITHTQEPTKPGDRIHALQIFVNLPARLKGLDPDSFLVRAKDVPVVKTREARIRVVAGSYAGVGSPAPVPQPVSMLDGYLAAGGSVSDLPLPGHWNAWIYALEGEIRLGGITLRQGETVCAAGSSRDAEFSVLAPRGPAHFVVLAGERIKEPVFQQGPFVMDSAESLAQVIADYHSGRFGDHAERGRND